ncbi:hypothetical protein HPP92_028312 [Vanilla planifolia]|uniref:Uncharacterized protein n=1 Tax=Vanilla planifolia TaxID=51239 RepID=A0A835PBF9_VANPL|nr:hypothetical protein HPP92_028312 [Vanilla planifolia]KAG0447550.1 hypothetical protein HPP92_028281 [Vanilla planifolia]
MAGRTRRFGKLRQRSAGVEEKRVKRHRPKPSGGLISCFRSSSSKAKIGPKQLVGNHGKLGWVDTALKTERTATFCGMRRNGIGRGGERVPRKNVDVVVPEIDPVRVREEVVQLAGF